MVTWPCCLWACGKIEHHNGSVCVAEEAFHLMVVRKQRKQKVRDQGPRISQGHASND
jgi:hypothetical protein